MEFLFLCSTSYLTHLLLSLVRNQVEHSKRNFISPRAHVLFSIYHPVCNIIYQDGAKGERSGETARPGFVNMAR